MPWLLATVLGHIFTASAIIFDKFFVSKIFRRPATFAVVIGAFSIFAVVLIPFGVGYPGFFRLLVNIASGAAFTLALVFLYSSLKHGEATRVAPFMGGLIPIFTFLFAYLALSEKLAAHEMLAFVFLIVGGALVALNRGGQFEKTHIQGFFYGAVAAVLFAFSAVMAKYAYIREPFIEAFFWQRIGGALVVPFLLSDAGVRHESREFLHQLFGRTGAYLLLGKLTGATGFVLLQYAIKTGSVTLVQALAGLQYVFLFVLATFATIFFPKILKEHLNGMRIAQKILAIILVGLGLFLLA
ncbi:MAG: hypothetical protein HW383_192 [Candidatus Magasanikbacteria bacterium]|nr:hypothetical protein [Candidatus Magasanikbacteria bacterium]